MDILMRTITTLLQYKLIHITSGVYYSISNTIIRSLLHIRNKIHNNKLPRSSNEYLHKKDKMGNHGGSPPNLGLKEATHQAWGKKA